MKFYDLFKELFVAAWERMVTHYAVTYSIIIGVIIVAMSIDWWL